MSTAATKDHIINTKLIPYFKNFKVTEIKAKDIVKWQNELLSYRNPETGKTLHENISENGSQSDECDHEFCGQIL